MLSSIDFDHFMTSEGPDMLILAFISNPGQSVASNTHRFYSDFSIRERVYLGIL